VNINTSVCLFLHTVRLFVCHFYHSEAQNSKMRFASVWKRLGQKYLIWNCCPFWRAVKGKVQLIALDPLVDLIIMICIIVNTFFMALEHPGMSVIEKKLICISDKVS